MARALKSLRVHARPRKKDKQIWLSKSEKVQEHMRAREFFQNSITSQRTRVRIKTSVSQNFFGESSLTFKNKKLESIFKLAFFNEAYRIFSFYFVKTKNFK